MLSRNKFLSFYELMTLISAVSQNLFRIVAFLSLDSSVTAVRIVRVTSNTLRCFIKTYPNKYFIKIHFKII